MKEQFINKMNWMVRVAALGAVMAGGLKITETSAQEPQFKLVVTSSCSQFLSPNRSLENKGVAVTMEYTNIYPGFGISSRELTEAEETLIHLRNMGKYTNPPKVAFNGEFVDIRSGEVEKIKENTTYQATVRKTIFLNDGSTALGDEVLAATSFKTPSCSLGRQDQTILSIPLATANGVINQK